MEHRTDSSLPTREFAQPVDMWRCETCWRMSLPWEDRVHGPPLRAIRSTRDPSRTLLCTASSKSDWLPMHKQGSEQCPVQELQGCVSFFLWMMWCCWLLWETHVCKWPVCSQLSKESAAYDPKPLRRYIFPLCHLKDAASRGAGQVIQVLV